VIIRPAPPEHYPWIAKRASLVIGPGFRAIEAVDREGNIAGMVGYDGWTDNSVSMHIALDNPAALRHILRPAFGIPFVEFGKGVVFGTVLSTNEKALKLDKHVGFREVARLKDAWAKGVDAVVLEMRREDCRWIPQEARKAA
jgi:RimJ/RimL family protein N-acetyltransferase